MPGPIPPSWVPWIALILIAAGVYFLVSGIFARNIPEVLVGLLTFVVVVLAYFPRGR